MVWVKKCRDLSWGNISLSKRIFSPCRKSGTIYSYIFCSTAIVDKIIRRNIIYNLLYQLVVDTRKYSPQKG